ncbi:MAG: DinB family protein [Acidobacteriota bacterium]|nr:DinB family protein [Acidobacteriota bacterium]
MSDEPASEVATARATEVARLIDQFERAIDGDAWHGDPVMTILGRVTFETAGAKPAKAAHSIRQIVRHMAAWTNEVRRRMNGEPAGTPLEGDWPRAADKDEDAWRAEIAALAAAHQSLLADLRALPEARLFEPINDPRNRATGAGVSRYVLLHGLAQHHAYHAGQIAILSKF